MRLDIPKFNTQGELFEYLVKNKKDLTDLKKSVTKYADSFGGLIATSGLISKASANNQDTEDTVYRTVVGNTYMWMDSHDDVHLNNVFGVSINQKGAARIPHRHDHINQLTAKVGKFSNVYEQVVNWTDLGVNKAGQTMSLLGDSAIKKLYNPLIFESYKDGEIDQHSVGMQYVVIDLAVNDPKMKEEYAVWVKHINQIGNKEKAEEKGYFWAVKEAKLIEISCVSEGSNEITGIYSPSKDSLNIIDPALTSQKTKSIYNILAN